MELRINMVKVKFQENYSGEMKKGKNLEASISDS